MAELQTIKFYRTGDPHGYMSNFAPYPITLADRVWPTSEHYFQAQKFADTAYAEEIRLTVSPMKAAQLGRSRTHPLRPDWEALKDSVMLEAVLAKFSQHVDIRKQLFSTGNAVLVEHTVNDRYWADGGDGSGLNKLGLILMQVRDFLRDHDR